MKRFLTGAAVLGLMAMPAVAGTIITPLEGTLGNPFNNGAVSGWGWNGVQGGGAGPLIGNLYDNFLTINGGAASGGLAGPFMDIPGTQAFVDWGGPNAQWGDDLHGLAGPALGGPTAVVTSIRYSYTIPSAFATATHTIVMYDMVVPSGQHNNIPTFTVAAPVLSMQLTGMPTGANIVTVTGLSVNVGTAAWIKFGESGLGFPGTFWLTGGIGNGNGTTHNGNVYDNKDYYGPGLPLHYFIAGDYFYFAATGYVARNVQVALSGFVIPAPAVMSLLGLGGLMTLRRRRR